MRASIRTATVLMIGAMITSGCGSSAPPTVTVTSTETATVTQEPTAEATTPPEPTPPIAASQTTETSTETDDVTEELLSANSRQPWRSRVITAVQAEPDWVEIQTTIVDPRGGTTGSPEAKEAIAICKAGAAMLQSQGTVRPNVRVYESNGTTFAYSGKTSNYRCVEY